MTFPTETILKAALNGKKTRKDFETVLNNNKSWFDAIANPSDLIETIVGLLAAVDTTYYIVVFELVGDWLERQLRAKNPILALALGMSLTALGPIVKNQLQLLATRGVNLNAGQLKTSVFDAFGQFIANQFAGGGDAAAFMRTLPKSKHGHFAGLWYGVMDECAEDREPAPGIETLEGKAFRVKYALEMAVKEAPGPFIALLQDNVDFNDAYMKPNTHGQALFAILMATYPAPRIPRARDTLDRIIPFPKLKRWVRTATNRFAWVAVLPVIIGIISAVLGGLVLLGLTVMGLIVYISAVLGIGFLGIGQFIVGLITLQLLDPVMFSIETTKSVGELSIHYRFLHAGFVLVWIWRLLWTPLDKPVNAVKMLFHGINPRNKGGLINWVFGIIAKQLAKWKLWEEGPDDADLKIKEFRWFRNVGNIIIIVGSLLVIFPSLLTIVIMILMMFDDYKLVVDIAVQVMFILLWMLGLSVEFIMYQRHRWEEEDKKRMALQTRGWIMRVFVGAAIFFAVIVLPVVVLVGGGAFVYSWGSDHGWVEEGWMDNPTSNHDSRRAPDEGGSENNSDDAIKDRWGIE